jgi:hypothetical protein
MRVFLSHSRHDKDRVIALAEALKSHGIDPWLDKWEIRVGQDLVAAINDGLEECAAGIVVLSEHTRGHQWVGAELSYLIYAVIQEGKTLIPIVLGDDLETDIPPLLRPLARTGIDDIEAIVDALRNPNAATQQPAVLAPERGKAIRFTIRLEREDPDDSASPIHAAALVGDRQIARETRDGIPPRLMELFEAFQDGVRASGVWRDIDSGSGSNIEANMIELGHELRAFCLPGDAAGELASLLDGCPVGSLVEVNIEANTPKLLALPFEALRAEDDQLLSVHPCAGR